MAAPFTIGEFVQIALLVGAICFGAGFLACALVRGWWAERGCGK